MRQMRFTLYRRRWEETHAKKVQGKLQLLSSAEQVTCFQTSVGLYLLLDAKQRSRTLTFRMLMTLWKPQVLVKSGSWANLDSHFPVSLWISWMRLLLEHLCYSEPLWRIWLGRVWDPILGGRVAVLQKRCLGKFSIRHIRLIWMNLVHRAVNKPDWVLCISASFGKLLVVLIKSAWRLKVILNNVLSYWRLRWRD